MNVDANIYFSETYSTRINKSNGEQLWANSTKEMKATLIKYRSYLPTFNYENNKCVELLSLWVNL